MAEKGPRSIAAGKGEQFYHGKPCKLGHTLRYTASYGCVACRRAMFNNRPKPTYNGAYQAYWRANNPDKVRAIRKRYYAKALAKEKAQARHRVWRAKLDYTLQIMRDDGYCL